MIAVLFAILSGVSYGASDFGGALATKRNDAWIVTLLVQIISLLALAVVLWLTFSGQVTAIDLVWGVIGGAGATVGLITFYRALAEGPMSAAASVTALVGSTLPVGVGLALGEVPNQPTLVGVALAIPAAIIVSAGGLDTDADDAVANPRTRTLLAAQTAATRRLSVLAGLGFGVFFIALAQASPDSGLLPLLGARVASVIGLICLLTIRRGWDKVHVGDLPTIVGAGILDFAANALYLLALADGSVTWVAAVVSLYPVATVVLARLVLSENLSRAQLFGLGMAASSLVFFGLGAG